jgi:hypothetical protein
MRHTGKGAIWSKLQSLPLAQIHAEKVAKTAPSELVCSNEHHDEPSPART